MRYEGRTTPHGAFFFHSALYGIVYMTDLNAFLFAEGITCFGLIPFSDCVLTNERAARRLFGKRIPTSVLFAAVPYFVNVEKSNISIYAYSRDYHLYFSELSKRLHDFLDASGYADIFVLSGDNSPVDERDAAAKAGVGFLGDNGLLINETLGSYFFICGIYFFEMPPELLISPRGLTSRTECTHCGACVSFCPTGALSHRDIGACLSAVTQKKRVTPEEEKIIAKNKSVWGCDICQSVCPFNKNIKNTQIPFFSTELYPFLTPELYKELSDSDKFKERAYAWRGPEVIKRNLGLYNK